MLRTTISILLLLSVMNIAYGQLESLSPLDYEIDYKLADSYLFKVDLYNPTENDIEFNWTLDYNFELTSDFSYFNTDLENEYFPGLLSICNSNVINILTPMDTMSIYVGFKTIDILPDVLANGPELNYYLQSPDCDSTYLHYTFKIVDRTVSITDESDYQFNVYPNPASDRIFMDIPNADNGQVLIHNRLGQVVINKRTLSSEEADGIDISSLPAGLYNLKYVSSGAQSENQYHSQFIKVE